MVWLPAHEQALLLDLDRDGVLTTAQVHRRHYPGRSRKTVLNRLALLTAAGLVVRRVWGYDPQDGRRVLSGWCATGRGLRRVGLAVPAVRGREGALASLAHDATVADLRERVEADLAGEGVRWTTERELARDESGPSAPTDQMVRVGQRRRPDGVLTLADGRRIAVEVDTSRHAAGYLTLKVAAYRRAIAQGDYAAVVWYAVSGGTMEAVRRALDAHGGADRAAGRLDVCPIPAGVTVYR